MAVRVSAEEIWVAPTHQQDFGGLGVASNVVWPVTAIGAVRLALAIPDDLQTFQSAKVVLLPNSPSGAADLVVYECEVQPGNAATSNCSAATPHPFVGTANQLIEVDISAAVAARVGVPGVTYLGILAYSTPTTNSDRIVGMRFAYSPTPPGPNTTVGPPSTSLSQGTATDRREAVGACAVYQFATRLSDSTASRRSTRRRSRRAATGFPASQATLVESPTK